jgi:hypothetical protein
MKISPANTFVLCRKMFKYHLIPDPNSKCDPSSPVYHYRHLNLCSDVETGLCKLFHHKYSKHTCSIWSTVRFSCSPPAGRNSMTHHQHASQVSQQKSSENVSACTHTPYHLNRLKFTKWINYLVCKVVCVLIWSIYLMSHWASVDVREVGVA